MRLCRRLDGKRAQVGGRAGLRQDPLRRDVQPSRAWAGPPGAVVEYVPQAKGIGCGERRGRRARGVVRWRGLPGVERVVACERAEDGAEKEGLCGDDGWYETAPDGLAKAWNRHIV